MTPLPYQTAKLETYRLHAPNYDAAASAVVGEDVLRQRHRWAAEVVSPGQRVLDIGCGTGTLLRVLADAVGPAGLAVGADLSPAMLAVARDRIAPVAAQTRLVLLDATVHLPLRDASFDAVCAFGLFQELPTPRAALEELHRVLRPGGAFRGLATSYRQLNPAAESHMAAAEAEAIFLRPQNVIATMFLQIFGPAAATRWEHNPRLTDPAVWESLPGQPLRDILARVRAAGHDPRAVELGVLYMAGRKVA